MHRHLTIHLTLLLSVVTLSGCSWFASVLPSHTTDESVYGRGLSHDAEINHWLKQAERALYKDRLIKPANDNAYLYYSHVLRKDPANVQARKGIQAIGERFRELAKTAHDNGKDKQALRYLAHAEAIQQNHPDNHRTRNYLQSTEQGKRQRSLEARYKHLLPSQNPLKN